MRRVLVHADAIVAERMHVTDIGGVHSVSVPAKHVDTCGAAPQLRFGLSRGLLRGWSATAQHGSTAFIGLVSSVCKPSDYQSLSAQVSRGVYPLAFMSRKT